MQKELSINQSGSINLYNELGHEFTMQAQIGMCPTLTSYHHPASTDSEPTQFNCIPDVVRLTSFQLEQEANQIFEPTSPTEETYAELPISEAQDNQEPMPNETQEQNNSTETELQPNNPAPQSKGWASTLVSVPAKIVSVLNPLNWLPSKNTANAEQPKIIIEEDNANPENSVTINEAGNPGNKEDPFSTLDQLTPDDSDFKDATSTDSSLTGDDSNLAETQ